MSKKRHREQPAVDVQKVEIYEDLASIDEKVRLKAAKTLLTDFIVEETSTGNQLNEIIRRLIRGLCSGRKAARLGFSIALTESLSEIYGPRGKTVPELKSIADLIGTLIDQTSAIGSLSGQVRDAQRVFKSMSTLTQHLRNTAIINMVAFLEQSRLSNPIFYFDLM